MRQVPRAPGIRWLALGAVALVLAVAFAPMHLASLWPGGGFPDVSALRDSLSSGFVRYWSAGGGVLGPDLARPVDYWARFHLVKAVLATMLLLVLLPLGTRTWARYIGADVWWRRLLVGSLAVFQSALAVLALLVVVANIQGAIAPWSSAMGLLPLGSADPALAATVEGVRGTLTGDGGSPALDALVHDFAVYHVAMAVLGVLVIVGLLGAGWLLWRRRARVPRADRRRRVLASMLVAIALLTAFFSIVTAANISTAADPAPALLGVFEGGR